MPDEFSGKRANLRRAAVGLAGIFLAAVTWSGWSIAHEQAVARGWVEHTHQVTERLEAVRGSFQEAETGQRGFLLTGGEAYLGSYLRGKRGIETALAELKSLTRDNARQQRLLGQIQGAATAKLSEMAATIQLRRDQGLKAATAIVSTDQGLHLMDEIRTLLGEMRNNEDDLLAVRRESEAKAARLLAIILGVLVATSMILGVVIGWLLQSITRLQSGLVTVCAWTREVRHEGVWMPVDKYLTERFGLDITHGMSEKAAAEFRRNLTIPRSAGDTKKAPSGAPNP